MKARVVPQEQCDPWALKVLGDYVTLRIVDTLRTRELRFTEIQRRIIDSNPVVLTERLKRLESWGLVERREATLDRHSVTYRLTDAGREFLPVLAAIETFTNISFEKLGEAQPIRGRNAADN